MFQVIFFLLVLKTPAGAFDSYVIGGKTAEPHSRPYMASLQVDDHHVCGGFLIREDFVLTAAHCYNNRPLTVVLGAHNIRKKEKSQQKIEVKKFYKHGLHSLSPLDFDLMLLKLKANATLNENVKLLTLPKKEVKVKVNTRCSVAGWGKKTANGNAESVLQEATLTIQDNKQCKKIWQKYFNSKNMLCTHFGNGKSGICQGDSGGPLVCNTTPNASEVLGVVSYSGPTCDDSSYPHVYMKVHSFLKWINEKMKN
uniref:Granzyme 3, tandem duplicate 3 n=1 Tax=Lepisosteus oculatus TaxID=7918 RepID=W5MGL5_LEPOC|nr:PREDICTED: granzyme B-like [Lepisosteus oculatus]